MKLSDLLKINPQPKDKKKSKSNKKFVTIEQQNIPTTKTNKKKERENYFKNLSQKKRLLETIIPEKVNPESNAYSIKTKKINKSKEQRKYKDYPNNLIKGVLTQAIYNNLTNNINYNEYIRYKPINDIFNEQSNIPTRKITENNNSLNISFNSKSDFRENELKMNIDGMKHRKNDSLIKSGKSISPIIQINSADNKKEKNEIVTDYINIKSSDKKDNIINNKNNTAINKEFINVEIQEYNDAKDNRIILKVEQIDSFNIINNVNDNIIIEEIESFNIINNANDDIIIEEIESFNIINNDNSKIDNDYNRMISIENNEQFSLIQIDDNKEKEKYNKNMLKDNCFSLMKRIGGNILYEINLEKNIEEINSNLEKEKVYIDNEQIIFITKREYEKLMNTIEENNKFNDEFKIENDEINKDNEFLRNSFDLIKEENNKLNEKIKSLNENILLLENELNILNNENEKLLKELEQKKFPNNIKIKNFDINIIKIYKNDHFEITSRNIRSSIKDIKKEKEKKEEIKRNKENKIINEEIKIKDNKDIKNKIDIFNKKNNNEDNNNQKIEKKPNKIFLLDKKEETNEEKMKREERMNKALKRVKNKRKLDEENKKARKSAIIERISNELENELKKNEGKKLYVDLEYEENKEDEDSN